LKRFDLLAQLSRLSLLRRYELGLFMIVAPMAVVVIAGFFYVYMPMVAATDSLLHTVRNELDQVVELQIKVTQSAMPVNDYLIHGEKYELDNFRSQSQAVEEIFRTIRKELSQEQERLLIDQAWKSWQKARGLGEGILRLANPVGNALGAETMEIFDQEIDKTVSIISQLDEISHLKIDQTLVDLSNRNQASILVMGIGFLVALGLAVGSGIAFVITVITPLRRLSEVASQMGQGNLSIRMKVRGTDEIGQLATVMNDMAVQLDLDRRVLEEIATQDALTGLYNRRSFDERMVEELGRSKRFSHPCSLLMMDLDNFKNVNDTFGHQAGDKILKEVSVLIRGRARAQDFVARYGGEEMTAILPETPHGAALYFAEQLRELIDSYPFRMDGKKIPVTISIGVATYPEHGIEVEDIIGKADEALYEAKGTGRNRVCGSKDTLKAGQG